MKANLNLEKVCLQPLRIPAGWKIRINQLYELDPDWQQIESLKQSGMSIDDFFEEDMFFAEKTNEMIAVDVGWVYDSEGKKYGEYSLQLLRLEKVKDGNNTTYEPNYDKPLEEYMTKNRLDLIEKMNHYFNWPGKTD